MTMKHHKLVFQECLNNTLNNNTIRGKKLVGIIMMNVSVSTNLLQCIIKIPHSQTAQSRCLNQNKIKPQSKIILDEYGDIDLFAVH